MCYDDVLVMPNNYEVMDEEEMTYVDGGARIKVNLTLTFTDNLCKAAYSAGVASYLADKKI